MLHFVLVLGFVSSLVCQIQFPSVDLSSPTSSTLISTNQDFSRLFTLNEFGHIECQKRTDCPPDFVDTENKTVINYSCEDPISKIPNISAAPPENEDPARTCAEDLNGFYCADRTRPGCELCPGVIRRILNALLGTSPAVVPVYCEPPLGTQVFGGSPPRYLRGTLGQTISSLNGLQGKQGCPSSRPCRYKGGRCCRVVGLGRGGRVLACPRRCSL